MLLLRMKKVVDCGLIKRVAAMIMLCGVAALAGCTTTPIGGSGAPIESATAADQGDSKFFLYPWQMSVEKAKATFVGRTRVISASSYGSQVAYMAPDGMVYLWFPGNRVILPGRWTFERGSFLFENWVNLCFQYGPGTVNAWTRRDTGKECSPAEARARLIQDSAEGDVFGLSRKSEVPFVLPSKPTNIREIKERLGLN
jgi:hypothetical protein